MYENRARTIFASKMNNISTQYAQQVLILSICIDFVAWTSGCVVNSKEWHIELKLGWEGHTDNSKNWCYKFFLVQTCFKFHTWQYDEHLNIC